MGCGVQFLVNYSTAMSYYSPIYLRLAEIVEELASNPERLKNQDPIISIDQLDHILSLLKEATYPPSTKNADNAVHSRGYSGLFDPSDARFIFSESKGNADHLNVSVDMETVEEPSKYIFDGKSSHSSGIDNNAGILKHSKSDIDISTRSRDQNALDAPSIELNNKPSFEDKSFVEAPSHTPIVSDLISKPLPNYNFGPLVVASRGELKTPLDVDRTSLPIYLF